MNPFNFKLILLFLVVSKITSLSNKNPRTSSDAGLIETVSSFNFSEYRIVGEDDRLPVLEKSQRTAGIGVLESKFSNSEGCSTCTATIISDKYLITAAHCVYDLKLNEYAQEISFMPGLLKSAPNVNDRFFIDKIYILKGYKDSKMPSGQSVSNDLAILRTTNYNQTELKEYGVKTLKEFPNQSISTTLFGYPGEKLDIYSLWRAEGFSSKDNYNGIIKSTCDTTEGMSGGPLLDSNNNITALNAVFLEDDKNHNYFSEINFLRKNAIINVIRTGMDDAFYSKVIDAKPYFSVHFRNKTPFTIYIAVAYFDLETNKTIIDGYFPVKANSILHNAFRTATTKIALYAQDKEGTLEWTAPDHKLKIRGEEKEFYAEKLPSTWKDKTYTYISN